MTSSGITGTTGLTGTTGVIGVLLIVVAVSVAGWSTWQTRRRRRLAAARAQAPAWRSRGYHLIRVDRVYQRARTGTKAIVVWDETGARQDTWFKDSRPSQGSYFFVRGSVGYGPHNRNPNVLYLHPGDVVRAG